MRRTARSAPARRALITVLVATVAALVLGTTAGAGASSAPQTSPRALALHDDMRALWEAHGTWTERAIVDFVGGLPETNLVVARLLRNRTDIGNAAVGVLNAAKSGNEQSVATAKAAFFANGDQVAAFLNAANPKHWALADMRTMMRVHLNQVIALAVDQLDGHYSAAIRLYDVYIGHIIDMADMLSTGIMEQFPARFR